MQIVQLAKILNSKSKTIYKQITDAGIKVSSLDTEVPDEAYQLFGMTKDYAELVLSEMIAEKDKKKEQTEKEKEIEFKDKRQEIIDQASTANACPLNSMFKCLAPLGEMCTSKGRAYDPFNCRHSFTVGKL